MRILVTRPMPAGVLDPLASADLTVRDTNTPLTPAEAAEALRDYDVILPTLRDAFTAEAFSGEVRAKLLANFGVGYNHIDVEAAKAKGVVVTNTPGAVTDATADTATMLILMTCRRAGEGERMVRADAWEGWHPTQLLGFHVSGKRLGIIGMGRIGKAIARRAQAGFGMEIVFHNRSETDAGVPARQVPMDEVLSTSDIVVLTVPATPQTHHLMDAAAFAAMQPHAYLVNISRGDVVDEAALIAALQEGRIAGAGLDVYEREPEVPAALRALENVTLLPHLGTATLEVRQDMGRMAVDNVRAILDGRDPPNPV